MKKLSEQEIRQQMEEILADQMARPSLRPRTKLEDEAEAFARETPAMAEYTRKRAEQDSHAN